MGDDVVDKGVAKIRTSVLARSGPMIERLCRGLRCSLNQGVVACAHSNCYILPNTRLTCLVDDLYPNSVSHISQSRYDFPWLEEFDALRCDENDFAFILGSM